MKILKTKITWAGYFQHSWALSEYRWIRQVKQSKSIIEMLKVIKEERKN